MSALSTRLSVTRAELADIDATLNVLKEAARWLLSRGINQWQPEEFTVQLLSGRIERGELYIARLGNDVAGTMTLQASDEYTWGAKPNDALYVHSLAVRPVYAGQGLGREMLRRAEQLAVAGDKEFLRLDCWAGNKALRSYYREAGFEWRGDKHFPEDGWEVALFEKRLQPAHEGVARE